MGRSFHIMKQLVCYLQRQKKIMSPFPSSSSKRLGHMFFHFQTLTQWSRACRKSNSSSVQSSSVSDLELTRASHSSRCSFVCTQCSDSSHFALIVSRGSCETRHKCQILLKIVQLYQYVYKNPPSTSQNTCWRLEGKSQIYQNWLMQNYF